MLRLRQIDIALMLLRNLALKQSENKRSKDVRVGATGLPINRGKNSVLNF